MASSKICTISNVNLVCLGIDYWMWVILAAGFGYFYQHVSYAYVTEIFSAFAMATLMTIAMIVLELFGTTKRNQIAMAMVLLIRCLQVIIGSLVLSPIWRSNGGDFMAIWIYMLIFIVFNGIYWNAY